MDEVDLDVVPLLEAERARSFVRAEAEQRLGRDHIAAAALAACDPLELAQLLERIDADIRVGADADADAALAHPLDGQKAVSEVRLRRRTRADARTGLRDQVELGAVGVRGVHDSRALAQAPAPVEQLDRADAVLGEAFLDLPRLLVAVDVQRQLLRRRVVADLREPARSAGTYGVGGKADRDATAAQVVHLPEILGRGLLTEARQPAALVSRQEQHDADARLLCRLDCRERLVVAEVVELAHRRVAGRTELAVHVDVLAADGVRRLSLRLPEHELTPGPEVAAAGASAQRTLERVAVDVHEAGQGEGLGHGRILSTPM